MKIFFVFLVFLLFIFSGCKNSRGEELAYSESEDFTAPEEISLAEFPEHEPLTLLPRYIPAPVEISDFGRTAAEEFLRDYWSLYSFGEEFNDVIRDFYTGEILDERPLVLLRQYRENNRSWSALIDRDDVPIEDAVFAAGHRIAHSFSLY
ncbi:MAG: hypothetical protein LBI27_01015, partial [Clostridiales bacterium]|nr:hypothetical protein [Clostridiales bacterium]